MSAIIREVRLGCLLLLVAVLACSAEPQALPLSPVEQQLFEGQNQERELRSLRPLVLDPKLVEVARVRARQLAAEGRLSHTSEKGETAFSLLKKSGYLYGEAAENVARNSFDEDEAGATVVEGFLDSEGHRKSMLDSGFTATGIGAAKGHDGLTYFAVLYARN